MEIAGKRFLVVGGSGVLGAELTRQLHARGATVLATTMSNDTAAKIPAVAEVRLLLDYQSPDSIKTLTDYLLGASQIDGLINAAGVVAFGAAGTLDQETIQRLFAVNTTGPIQLLSALHPLLAQSAQSGNSPVALNITGVVAEQPLPNLAAYSASKIAMAGFLQALSREWRREGINVISANPPHTETGLASRAIAGEAPNFGAGLDPAAVVEKLLHAIAEDLKTLPSSEF
jgi:short-subunit dehydrogenase